MVEDSLSCNKNKRILWLLNHTTLQNFELPLLTSLGFEVFTPKQVPTYITEWSGSVTYDCDATLTIAKEDLEILNKHDFYSGTITPEISKIINCNFGNAFCMIYSLEQLVNHFDGNIFLRAFGLAKTISYSKILTKMYGKSLLNKVNNLGERFWFSQTYPNLAKVEHHIFKKQAITHSLGLPDYFYKNADSWTGSVNKILFFCPRIFVSTYYKQIYNQFKSHFGDISHLIAGNQITISNEPAFPVNTSSFIISRYHKYKKMLRDKINLIKGIQLGFIEDSTIAGLQPRAIIDEWLQTYKVMFYHSQEPRHLHYHPLEAIIFGMPLIYMKGGLLEKIGGKSQPGAARSFKEAREKILRILNNDVSFIEDIRLQQKSILKSFSFEYVKNEWERNFVSKIMPK